MKNIKGMIEKYLHLISLVIRC